MRGASVVRVLLAIVLVAAFASIGIVRTDRIATALPDWQPYINAAETMALALTVIDYRTVDRDVQRILDNATGVFYDDFSKRAADFAEVVRDAQSSSTGTVTDSRLESHSNGQARVLVTVSAATTNVGQPDPPPRVWRLRITEQKIGDTYKASNVEFLT
jgi:hypothetical protein